MASRRTNARCSARRGSASLRRVRREERLDDARGELRAQVEREVRKAHAMREPAGGPPPRWRCKHRRLLVVLRNRARARGCARPPRGLRADEQRGGPAESTPAAHGDERAVRVRRERGLRAAAAPRAWASASAARSAAWNLPGESARARRRPRARRRGRPRAAAALDERDDRAAGGGRGAAAEASKPGGDAVRPRPAGRCGSGRRTRRRPRCPNGRPRRRAEALRMLEVLGEHGASECRSGSGVPGPPRETGA
jgi:hypothetical protein